MNKTSVTVKFYFPPIPVEGVGRSSGTQRPQKGFVANGVEATIDVKSRKISMHWLGTKHGRQISDWFISNDPALTEVRVEAREAVIAAARAVDAMR